jgi:hypothetical protein
MVKSMHLKNKLIGLTEKRLEELGYSFEEIQNMGLEELSIGELVLASIGAVETLNENAESTSKGKPKVVEYEIKDEDFDLIQSIKLYEVEKTDSEGSKYNQLSLINF